VLRKTVVMVGMMGAGKTAVGRSLAELLGVRFVDSDVEIEAASNMTIAEVFERYGEAFFRQKEAQVIERLLLSEPCVLSTGGGAFLQENNRLAIAKSGVSVWLNADIDLLWQRVRYKTTRPLLRTNDPKATLAGLYKARVPFYEMAQTHVACERSFSIEQMAKRVRDVLLNDASVLERVDA